MFGLSCASLEVTCSTHPCGILYGCCRIKVIWHTRRRNWHALSFFCPTQVHKAWICFAWGLPTPDIGRARFVETALWAKWKGEVPAEANSALRLCHKTVWMQDHCRGNLLQGMDFSVGKSIIGNVDESITGDEYLQNGNFYNNHNLWLRGTARQRKNWGSSAFFFTRVIIH